MRVLRSSARLTTNRGYANRSDGHPMVSSEIEEGSGTTASPYGVLCPRSRHPCALPTCVPAPPAGRDGRLGGGSVGVGSGGFHWGSKVAALALHLGLAPAAFGISTASRFLKNVKALVILRSYVSP